MTTSLTKPVTRILEDIYERGRPLMVRLTREGIYVKRTGERWTTAYLCPWQAAYTVGAKIRAREIQAERVAKRKAKRGGF